MTKKKKRSVIATHGTLSYHMPHSPCARPRIVGDGLASLLHQQGLLAQSLRMAKLCCQERGRDARGEGAAPGVPHNKLAVMRAG